MHWKDSQCSENYIEFRTQPKLTMHENSRQNNARSFSCQLCKSTFDRASQLDYHHRNTHLKEKSQICQFCGKGFFRKADLRTHLNIHLGTNNCICEICGRKFNHMSNLIRHCRMHSGVKPYPCLICSKRFTQISSLVRHKRIHEKTTDNFYSIQGSATSKNNISQAKNSELPQNEKVKRQHYCQVCGESFCFVYLLKEHLMSHSEDGKSISSKNSTEGSSAMNDVRDINQEQDSTILDYSQKNDEQRCIITDKSGEQMQVIQSVIYISSEQIQEANPDEVFLSPDQFLEHYTKINGNIRATMEMESDLNIDISEVLNSYNCDQIGILQNEMGTSYLYQEERKKNDTINFEKNNFSSLLNATTNTEVEEQNLNTKLTEYSLSDESLFDRSTALEECCQKSKDKSFNFDGNEFCIEDPELKSKMNDMKDSLCNDTNLDNINIASNTLLNYAEPTLHLIQTETGEQFYELVMNTFSEKLPDNYKKSSTNTKEASKIKETDNVDKIEYNLDNLINISHDLNNEFYDLQDEIKRSNLTHENEQLFYVSLNNKDYSVDISEKEIEGIQTLNLDHLENDPETDFENYVESNFEVFDGVSYENCAEKFFELIEIAEESSKTDVNESHRQSPILLRENGNEQFFELLDDSQGAQEIIYNTNSDMSVIGTNESPVLSYTVDNAELQVNINNHTESEDKIKQENSDAFVKNILGNFYDDELKNHVQNSRKTKGVLKKFECVVCQKLFSTAYSYKQHMGTHFTDQQKFHCKECGLSFAWKSTLNKHVANNHRSDGPQKFTCETCSKVYRTLSQVNEHVKRDHLKQRDHVCLYCGKSFFKKFDLKTHSRTHTNERPYVCRACGKTFHHQSHIIRHERIHSGERPYVCDICHKSFTQPGSLKIHKQKHRQTKMDILDSQLDEDDPLTLGKL